MAVKTCTTCGVDWKFGLTTAAVNSMLSGQDHSCASCGTAFDYTKKKAFCVDHCHSSGVVRGILCPPCNLGLGHFHDSPDKLRAAAHYLERNTGS